MPDVSEALTSSVNQGEHEHDGPVHPSLLAPTDPPKVPHRLRTAGIADKVDTRDVFGSG